MGDKSSILALIMVIASVAVLLGVYRHNEDVRYESDLGLKEHTLKLEASSRQLEEQLASYKSQMEKEIEKRRNMIEQDIKEEHNDVVSEMKRHINHNSRRLKSELLANPEIGKALSRRELAVDDNDFTAILIQADNSGIKMGDNGETNLYRQGPNTLQTDGSFVVGDWLKFGDKELVKMHGVSKVLNVYGNLDVSGALTATKLKSNYSHLSYVFKSAEQIDKGSIVSLLGGKLRKGFGVTVGNSDVVSANSAYVKVCYIAKDKFIVYYKDGNNGKAVIGTIDSNGKLSVSTPATYYTNIESGEHHIAVTAWNRVVAVFRERGGNKCRARIGTVDGVKLTWSGTITDFSTTCNQPVAASIGPDKVAIVYRNSGNKGTGLVGKLVDENTLNFGSSEDFHSFDVNKLDITRMKDDLAVFTFLDKTKSSRPMAQIFKARGTEVSFDSKKEIDPQQSSSVHITSVSGDKAVVAYREAGTKTRARVAVIDIVSGYLETGEPVTFSALSSMSPLLDTLSVSALGSDQMSGTTPATLNANRVLIGYRDHSGNGRLIDGDVVGKIVFLGKRQSFTTTKASSAAACAIGDRWVIGFQDDLDANKGKVRIVRSWGGSRALGIATTSAAGMNGDVGVALQGIADFEPGKFYSGGVYYASNDGQITATTGVGVAVGRALTDHLLLLENLASQNLFDVASENAAEGGGLGLNLMLARYRCNGGFSNGHWIIWAQTDFITAGAYDYHSNRRIYLKQDGIYHVTATYNIQGSANSNWMHLYVNGQHRLRTWESSGRNWWHSLHFQDLFQAKKDWYLQLQARWGNNGRGHNDGGRESGLSLIRVLDTYDPQ